MATDGTRLYVADQQAGTSGAILTVATTGAAKSPTVLAWHRGARPSRA